MAMGNAETMTNYAKMFHDMGYNVLVPDARGHGKAKGITLDLDGQSVKTMYSG